MTIHISQWWLGFGAGALTVFTLLAAMGAALRRKKP